MRKIITMIAATALTSIVYAGGINTNTNQHAAYQRNFAREATIDIDGAYSNPAGLVFMEDGLYAAFSVQCAFQERNIETTYAPFVMNGGSDTKKYEGEATAPFVPSLQAVYKKGDWAFSLNFSVPGGGGRATYDNGLPSFESMASSIPLALTAAGDSTGRYSINSYMKGQQYIFGTTLGVTHKFNENFSAYVGGRVAYAYNKYEGYIKDITVYPKSNGYKGIAAETYFEQTAQKLEKTAEQLTSLGQTATALQIEAKANEMKAYANKAKDKHVDCTQDGFGLAPIVGLDFKKGNVNIATRYEFRTKIRVKNKTVIDETGMYPDEEKSNCDMPALWTVGMDCNLLPNLKICLGYRYYFDKDAKMANDKQEKINHGTKEYAYGIEWDITKHVLISCGYLRTQYDFSDDYLSDMNFNQSSNNYGLGARFTLTKHLKLDVAGFITDYETRKKHVADYAGVGISGSDYYSRENFAFAIGANYKF
ncbi:MAG: hypothetical protein H6544_01325 [Prevotellaceae bacterium]|nr:hypothetical protein [Prevotellaceae bacterium]